MAAYLIRRLVQAVLILLGVLGAVSVLASEMPRPWAWPVAVAALAWGGWQARSEGRRPRRAFWFPGNDRLPTVDGTPMQDAHVLWRGPLAFLRWRDPDGRARRLVFWPDTLPAAARRELKLAMQRRQAAGGAASVAG